MPAHRPSGAGFWFEACSTVVEAKAEGEPAEGEGGEALGKQMALFDRRLEEGADFTDVIYEVILKLGYSLNARVEPLDLESNQAYGMTDEAELSLFGICLDDKLQGATIDSCFWTRRPPSSASTPRWTTRRRRTWRCSAC